MSKVSSTIFPVNWTCGICAVFCTLGRNTYLLVSFDASSNLSFRVLACS